MKTANIHICPTHNEESPRAPEPHIMPCVSSASAHRTDERNASSSELDTGLYPHQGPEHLLERPEIPCIIIDVIKCLRSSLVGPLYKRNTSHLYKPPAIILSLNSKSAKNIHCTWYLDVALPRYLPQCCLRDSNQEQKSS